MRRSLALGLALGALTLAACQVIAGIERVEKVDDPSSSSGSNGTSGTSGSSGINPDDPCQHVLPPDVPTANDGEGDGPPVYLATATLSLTKPPSSGITGYDIDRSCTCDPRPLTFMDGGAACRPRGNKTNCDEDGGIDNAASTLFRSLPGIEDLDQQFADDVIGGVRTIFIYLKDWNGRPNDLNVSIGIFFSNGANVTPVDPPSGNGDWSYPSSVQPGLGGALQPVGSLSQGYVSNGQLVVANAGTISILLGGNGLIFSEAFVVGDLRRDQGTGVSSFSGVVGGRIRVTDLLVAAGSIKVAGTTPACQYEQSGLNVFDFAIRPQICAAVDITEGRNADFKDTTCNAISSAIAVTAYSAKLSGDGPNDPEPSPDNPCSPQNPENANRYRCD